MGARFAYFLPFLFLYPLSARCRGTGRERATPLMIISGVPFFALVSFKSSLANMRIFSSCNNDWVSCYSLHGFRNFDFILYFRLFALMFEKFLALFPVWLGEGVFFKTNIISRAAFHSPVLHLCRSRPNSRSLGVSGCFGRCAACP